MMSTNSISLVAAIIVQIHYVIPSNNCTDCNSLRILLHDQPSSNIHHLEQSVDDIHSKNSKVVEKRKRSFDWTTISPNFATVVTTDGSLRPQMNSTSQTGPRLILTLNTISSATFSEMITSESTDNDSLLLLNTTVPLNTMTTTVFVNTTLDDRSSTAVPPPKSEKNLPLILGLTLGLGIPACLLIISGLIYYFKIYRPRHSRVSILTN